MKKRKVFALHKDINNLDDLEASIKTPLPEDLIWTNENPTYLFVTEHIFTVPKMFQYFIKEIKKKDNIIIWIGGECIAPDLNLFDYGRCFNRNLKMDDRFCFIPTKHFYKESVLKGKNEITTQQAKKEYQKRKFCNFIYSNAASHPIRDELFYKVSTYKKVDSLGKHLNNMRNIPSRRNKNWSKLSVDLKSNYRFSIACENAEYEGYISEKILTSFEAHSIPIYFGSPTIENEWNSKAFINVNNYENLDSVLDEIKRIDEDEELWVKMITEPWQTEEQIMQEKKDYEIYKKFIDRIFAQDVCTARRRPSGTWINVYVNFYSRKFSLWSLYVNKIKTRWRITKVI